MILVFLGLGSRLGRARVWLSSGFSPLDPAYLTRRGWWEDRQGSRARPCALELCPGSDPASEKGTPASLLASCSPGLPAGPAQGRGGAGRRVHAVPSGSAPCAHLPGSRQLGSRSRCVSSKHCRRVMEMNAWPPARAGMAEDKEQAHGRMGQMARKASLNPGGNREASRGHRHWSWARSGGPVLKPASASSSSPNPAGASPRLV